jgi:excisionase family DNA binding protein
MNSTTLEPALMKIEPACRYLDVGRSKLYELIRQGKLDAVKIGKSARVTTASLKRFVESLPASPGGSPIKRADAPSLEDLGLNRKTHHGPGMFR